MDELSIDDNYQDPYGQNENVIANGNTIPEMRDLSIDDDESDNVDVDTFTENNDDGYVGSPTPF